MPQDASPERPDPELVDHAPPGAMCLGCRYDLAGMDIRAKCPECGDRIASSVNNIALEHAPRAFVHGLDRATKAIAKAGVLALIGLALLCVGYGLRGSGMASQSRLFGTLFGSALLLVAIGASARQLWTLGAHRLVGEDHKARSFRTVLRVSAIIAVAAAATSAAVLVLIGTGRIPASQHRIVESFFVVWIAFLFVPLYVSFYLQTLAQRSRSLSPRLLMGLAMGGMLPMVFIPVTLASADESIFPLFGLPGAQPSSFPSRLPIDPPYAWPLSMAVCIVLTLTAITYFRRGMGFASRSPTSADQSHEPPRS